MLSATELWPAGDCHVLHPSRPGIAQLPGTVKKTRPWHRLQPTGLDLRERASIATSAAASTPAESSFDAEDELDSSPSRELAKYDVDRFRRQSQHLELMWHIQRVSQAYRSPPAGQSSEGINFSLWLCRDRPQLHANVVLVVASEIVASVVAQVE